MRLGARLGTFSRASHQALRGPRARARQAWPQRGRAASDSGAGADHFSSQLESPTAMNASEFLNQLYKRLDRRSSKAPRKTQRLTGFEPLEPRTVLSASGMIMPTPAELAGQMRN